LTQRLTKEQYPSHEKISDGLAQSISYETYLDKVFTFKLGIEVSNFHTQKKLVHAVILTSDLWLSGPVCIQLRHATSLPLLHISKQIFKRPSIKATKSSSNPVQLLKQVLTSLVLFLLFLLFVS
jgi:hypothetical protein